MNLGSEDAARMRHNRAIKKLIIRVGGFRPWLDQDIDDKPAQEPDGLIEQNEESDGKEREEDSEDSAE
jgi:hypothetical protein